MEKIDVIIPLYNDESNIGRCLESICRQTIADKIRIIIVDDGSKDNSVKVVKDTLENHGMLEKAKIICLSENRGVANARRKGAEAITGEYFLYCDSDDYMDLDMCEKLLNKAESDGCDMVVCDYKSIHGDDVKAIHDCYKEDFLRQLILCNVTGSLCNKLVKSSLINDSGFRFPDHDFSEDYVYSLQFAIRAKKIGYVPEPLYNYDHRDNSVVRSNSLEKQRKRYEDDMQNFKLDLEILEANELLDKYREEIIAHKLKMKNSNTGNLHVWRNMFPELDRDIFKSRYVSWRTRIGYYCKRLGIKKFI